METERQRQRQGERIDLGLTLDVYQIQTKTFADWKFKEDKEEKNKI